MNRHPRRALIVAALLTVGAGACTDTTELPITTITDTNYFNDPSSYRAMLAKIYAGLAVSGQLGPAGNGDIKGIDEGFSQYLRLYWKMQSLPTDEAVIAWGDVGLPELNTQLWASSNPFAVAMYYRIAFQVSIANELLRQTTDAKLAERNVSPELAADIQVFRAEARFLRALSYWHGIDLFGNIPLVTEEYVLGSLNAAVYTGTAQYGQALAEAQQAIAGPFSLDPNFRHVFQADNHTSPEIIFPIVQDGRSTQSFGGTTFLVHASCGGTMSAAAYGVDGCWFGLRMKPEAYNRYGPGDQRTSFFWTDGQTVQVNSISTYTDGIPAPKFTNKTSTGADGSDPTHTHPDTDFPVFRLADAYLIYAEAHLRGGGGDPAQALAYVNALRQRAYGSTAGDIAAPELTLQFILDERGRELLFEAHRRTDLIRYGLFTGGTYLWAWKGGAAAGAATETFRDLYPLPASELTTNPNLTQNPGY
jgi:starch-binding outer membrane protein, SusD/RagB family